MGRQFSSRRLEAQTHCGLLPKPASGLFNPSFRDGLQTMAPVFRVNKFTQWSSCALKISGDENFVTNNIGLARRTATGHARLRSRELNIRIWNKNK